MIMIRFNRGWNFRTWRLKDSKQDSSCVWIYDMEWIMNTFANSISVKSFQIYIPTWSCDKHIDLSTESLIPWRWTSMKAQEMFRSILENIIAHAFSTIEKVWRHGIWVIVVHFLILNHFSLPEPTKSHVKSHWNFSVHCHKPCWLMFWPFIAFHIEVSCFSESSCTRTKLSFEFTVILRIRSYFLPISFPWQMKF